MGIQAFVYQEVSQMDVSYIRVSCQTKLFKLHGMPPVLAKVACFRMLLFSVTGLAPPKSDLSQYPLEVISYL